MVRSGTGIIAVAARGVYRLFASHVYALSFFISLVSLTGCATPSAPTGAPVILGYVTASEGYPELTRKNQKYILAAQSRIYADDVLITDKDAKLILTMLDGSTFNLGPGTHFVLHHYRLSEQTQLEDADITISSGSIQTVLAPSELRRRVEIRTPLAKVSTSNGSFVSAYFLNENTLDVALLTGDYLLVKNDHGGREITRPGTGLTVIGDSAPLPVTSWTSQKLRQTQDRTKL